jgi:hypothetical protein
VIQASIENLIESVDDVKVCPYEFGQVPSVCDRLYASRSYLNLVGSAYCSTSFEAIAVLLLEVH